MNKWLYRAVGVASGALLLSSGVAHAESANEAKPTVDPQAMRGLLADLFTPTGGQHHLGLSIDMQRAVSSGILAKSPLDAQPSSNRIGFTARTPGEKDVFVAGLLPDLTNSTPTPDRFAGLAQRKELLPGLGLLGGAAGNGGLLGGLTGGAGGAGLVS
ncbi:MAG TPA: hypothetical protein DGT23_02075, partial [Micromonosporaceae bacterium]|nr:hypothetical protein [Micromonosporaceae bacterium]